MRLWYCCDWVSNFADVQVRFFSMTLLGIKNFKRLKLASKHKSNNDQSNTPQCNIPVFGNQTPHKNILCTLILHNVCFKFTIQCTNIRYTMNVSMTQIYSLDKCLKYALPDGWWLLLDLFIYFYLFIIFFLNIIYQVLVRMNEGRMHFCINESSIEKNHLSTTKK